MVVKWRSTELVFKGKKLRFREEIISVGNFKKWVVVCTQSRIHFFGDEDMTLSRPIKAAIVKEEGVYYHHKENNHVMFISHPFEPEEFVFFHHGFVLREVISGEMILEGRGRYLLRNTGRKEIGLEDPIESSCSGMGDDNFDETNRTRMLIAYKIEEGIRCLVEDYEEDTKNEGGIKMRITEYENFMVGIYGNTALFVRVGGSKGRVKRSKLLSETNVRFEKEAKHLIKYRMRLTRDKYLEFLRINDVLFMGNEIMCSRIRKDLWPKSRIPKKWMQNYYKPFWSGINEVEKNILSCYPRAMQRVFMGAFLQSKEKRFDLLEITEDVMAGIDRVLDEWLARCKSVWEFLGMEIAPIKGLETMSRCKELINYTCPSLSVGQDVMNIKFRRIMRCNLDAITGLKYSDVKNLGYRVIYMEMKKSRILGSTKPTRSINKLCRIAKKHFGDSRIEEVISLFDEKPIIFEIDEYDLENKKEKGYVLRKISNIGGAYLFYGLGVAKEEQSPGQLRFPIYKNGELGEIEIKDPEWMNWPMFNYSVSRSCGLSSFDEISHDFIESRILEFTSTGEGNEFEVAGRIFAFGLQGRLEGVHPQKVGEFITAKYPVVSMALLAGMGMSHLGKRDDLLGKMYLHCLKSPQPLYIHAGCIVGLGMLYAGSGNVFIRNVLSSEANKKGVFGDEQYNKGNKIWYDYTYRVLSSISLSMVYMKTSLDMFKFIELEDSLCELLTNGIVLFGSKQTRFRSKFKRSDTSTPEEVFYSELFLLGLEMNEQLDSIIEEVAKKSRAASFYELYRGSGRLLYVSLYLLYKGIKVDLEGSLFKSILEVCLFAERAMRENDEFKILFDASLVSLSLISNSSCNLDTIRILRRQIKATETGKSLGEQTDLFFTSSRCKQEAQLSMRYGDIERYKMCLGIVTCGMGTLKIASTFHLVLDVISTFFICFPISPVDQEYFNMTRYFLLLSMKENPEGFKSTVKYLKETNKRSRRKLRRDMSRINKIFLKEYSEASDADKKFIIDILTDFYEKYAESDNLLDVEMLKNIACKTP
ncbi:uncharacterized protein Eint_101110 [Encephalitozoon intestinalis ATCC 50506]|uniref:Anaphase-promoting complex subunit 1 n=1 Tax=Encephalitozoon intestinalis (strain ATCC 50506) TaxID=876142 RepID=E0S9Q1_ENCIT|nr:uncharacterized protein Eint_101110 [Encephalitozoon intestinalis ATCC 50506]ADM12436.1 hypothetical protein Eint_101110 [Encephalitozoon intestinalis ATCC 50506]UTX46272.1 anaphase-promoting complex subunit 1 [Encephalitozoon intestinalis]